MLPLINNKSFLECTEEDLKVLIENDDYRENEYIDYKLNFSFLESDNLERSKKISEFKSDICSFANADGGYLIYGISDNNGYASHITGISIPDDNTDKFELDRRNNLSSILPKVPHIVFRFIKLENGKYVVILYIKHDSFSPYIHLENEKDYKIYKRIGNGKRTVGYQELKNMFNQTLSLEREIYSYRMARINYYRSQEDNTDRWYSRFMLIHIIPETFLDSNYNTSFFIEEKVKGISFKGIFLGFCHSSLSTPCVDGLRVIGQSPYDEGKVCYLNNNGIAECFSPLKGYVYADPDNESGDCIYWQKIWEEIKDTYLNYKLVLKKMYPQKVFICVSILGCKDIISEDKTYDLIKKRIDRNTMVCAPIIADSTATDEETVLILKKLYIEFAISLGVKNDKTLLSSIQEVYGNNT